MRLFRRRPRPDLDARVADATARHEQAAEDAKLARARHAAVLEHVVKPLRQASERNQFADMLRASLARGHGGNA